MGTFLEVGLSNAIVASVLAVLAAIASRIGRRPALAHGLWLLVLLKLVTPPLVRVPLPWLSGEEPARASYSLPPEDFAANSWSADLAQTDHEKLDSVLKSSDPVD